LAKTKKQKMKDVPCEFADVLIELKPSPIHAVGVFAVVNIQKGQRVAEGIHEADYQSLVEWTDLATCGDAVIEKVMTFCVGMKKGFIPPENLNFNLLSVDWFMNHSCDGNVGLDERGDFVALRDITKGEELTYDYGLIESNPRFKMSCNCGSSNCRQTITGEDWKKTDFRSAHLKHMLPRLR
jgi:SET domain-containing protein